MKEVKTSPVKDEVPEKGDPWTAAMRNPDKGKKNFSIQLTISGGLPTKAYQLFIKLDGDGRMSCRYDSKLDRHKDEKSVQLDDKEIQQLINLLGKTRIFDFKQPPPRFIPDTVVGKLEIYLANLYHVQYFVADEKQAKYQEFPTHLALPKVLDWLYKKGARLLNKKNIKP
jgi:hypothetical protein